MILIVARARVRPGKREEALAAARRQQRASIAEAGCRDYGFWISLDDTDSLLVLERWEDAAALDAHLATPHTAEFSAALAGWVDGAPTIDRYEVGEPEPLR
jgi:quinol monooxygenase YgiN